MGRALTGKRALRKRLKDVKRELSAVQNDIRAIERGKPVSRRSVGRQRQHLGTAAADYAVPPLQGGRHTGDDPVESLLDAERRLPRQPVDERRLAQEDRVVKERAQQVRDERFSDYLASSFEAGGALRHERTVQRNKAVLLAVVVVLVLAWVLHRLLT